MTMFQRLHPSLAALAESLEAEGKNVPLAKMANLEEDPPRGNAIIRASYEWCVFNFWKNVNISAPQACWTWKKPLSGKQRYPSVNVSGIKILAHRFAWILVHGHIEPGTKICHECDNTICSNPSHLFSGTQRDNIADCISKGRFNPGRLQGEQHGQHKLTEDQAREILTHSNSAKHYSQQFGVSVPTIWAIWRRKNWKHL